MPQHYELALMCREILRKSGGHVPGWQCKETLEYNGCGAAVYENLNSNEMVIAFRGIDTGDFKNLLKNLITNLWIAFGRSPNTADVAIKFVSTIRCNRNPLKKFFKLISTFSCNQLFFTGHSLGAAIAEELGYHFHRMGKRYQVITFESPGSARLYTAQLDPKITQHFLTYLTPPNLINTRHRHVGNIRGISLKPYTPTFFGKMKYHINHILVCLINDYIRFYLLTLGLETISQLFLGYSLISQNLIQTLFKFTKDLLPFIYWNDYLEKSDLLRSRGLIILTLLCLKIYSTLIDILARTGQHHSIERFIQVMNQPNGEPKRYYNMSNWPNAQQFFVSHITRGLTWFVPFSKSNRGVRTIFEAESFDERMVTSTFGFELSSK